MLEKAEVGAEMFKGSAVFSCCACIPQGPIVARTLSPVGLCTCGVLFVLFRLADMADLSEASRRSAVSASE